MAKTIIDVSEHKKKINWETVKQHIDGAIIRLGYGDDDADQDDDYVAYNLAECERLGIPCEVYLYSYANSSAHIQSEIAHIKRLIGGWSVRVWLDLEERKYQSFWRKAAEAFLKAFPNGGIYSWEWTFTDILDGIECPRWICAYGPNDGKPHYDYKPHLDCHGWQYTSKATIPGISGTADVSEWYKDFAGAPTKAPAGASTSPTAGRNAVVNQMLAWEGYSEKNGKFKVIIDGYNKYLPTAVKAGCANYAVKYSDEWCATAASYAYIACGLGHMFPVECSCPRMITLAKKMGIWQENDGYVPDHAEAVLYDWQDSGSGDNQGTPDHIGIIISVDKTAGTFVVMEGNKDEAVGRRTMKIDGKYIRGFICPKFSEGSPAKPTPAEKKEEPVAKANTYEVSGTGTPSKKVVKTGILKKSMKVTARLQPVSGAAPCSFSPVKGLTRIDVCDTITDADGVKWDYCCVNGKYGFILAKSISSYVRTGGQPIDKVAQWVIADDFGTQEVRANCLKTLGYDADAVQDRVNEILNKVTGDHPRIRVYPIWFFEGDESRFGDCTAIIEYAQDNRTVAHCILIDAACAGAASTVIAKLKAQGVKAIDLCVISHAHGDHYGGLSAISKAIPVAAVYVPDMVGLDEYQKSYANALRRQAAKGKSSRILKAGDTFQIGHVKGTCLYQAPAGKLSEHDSHHFVNNQSMAIRYELDGTWTFHAAGDMQNEANRMLSESLKSLRADIFKVQWHGDANACSETICKAVKPLVAFSNYHHKERSGRGTTRKRLEAVGATVARNAENGDIFIDCQGGTMKLSCSKNNLAKTWQKVVPDTTKTAPAYTVMLSTKAKMTSGSGLLAIEPEDYTAAEILALKKAGYKVLGYLNVGSVEDYRSYYKTLEPYTLRKLDDWEHERYLDVCATAVQKWAIERGKAIINQGCDGLWIDNLDVYEEYPSDAAYKGITAILKALYAYGYIMVNGGMEYIQKAIKQGDKVANGITQEEVFSLIKDYSGKGTFSTQETKQSAAYQKYVATALASGMDAFLLEYTRDAALKTKIINYCKASGAGYYIADDVNL